VLQESRALRNTHGVFLEKATGHKAVFSFGSTGQLYTQITQDASLEVFLAADQERPQKAVPASRLGIWQSYPSA
jgi:ABC-type molybdate transport system substrate-binding protein